MAMTEGSDGPPVCDYCDQWASEEELRPVFFGDPPMPDASPIVSYGFHDGDDTSRAIGRREHPDPGGVQILGRTFGELAALLDALDATSAVTYESKRAVKQVHGMGGGTSLIEAMETEDAGIGVRLQIDPPEPEPPDPDMRVCGYCEEAIRGHD